MTKPLQEEIEKIIKDGLDWHPLDQSSVDENMKYLKEDVCPTIYKLVNQSLLKLWEEVRGEIENKKELEGTLTRSFDYKWGRRKMIDEIDQKIKELISKKMEKKKCNCYIQDGERCNLCPTKKEAQKIIDEFEKWHSKISSMNYGRFPKRPDKNAKTINGAWYWKGHRLVDLYQLKN